MELRQLRYFVAAAETGSISRAAERCAVAQPTVSQQIRQLERSLGAPLFDRLGRGVALTPAGRALLPRARRILSEVAETKAGLAEDLGAGRGRLVIGAIPTMAPYVLPPAMAALRAAYPECDLSVREDLTERLVDALVANEVDVAVTSAPIEHDLIDLEVVGEEPLLVVVSSEHPLAGGADLSLADLREQPAVSLHGMHCLGRQIAGFCSARRVRPNVVCHTAQLATVLEMVRVGLGVSLAPAMAAREDDSDARRWLRIRRGGPTREIGVARRLGRARSPVSEALGRFVRGFASELQSTAPPPRNARRRR